MTQLAEQNDTSAQTHDATPSRLAEARRQGRVARSTDLTAALTVLTAVVLIGYLGRGLLEGLRDMTALLLDGRQTPLASPEQLAGLTGSAMHNIFLPLAGVLAGMMMVAFAVGAIQVGGATAADAIKPRWARINPLTGLGRMMTRRMRVRAGLIVLKLILAAGVIAVTLQGYWQQLLRVGMGNADAMTAALGAALLRAGWLLAAGLVALGVLDWLYQRWQHRQDLKMTHEQWREDLRRNEGDPGIRRRQQRQAQQGRQRLALTVPRATTVLSDPDGPAVAIHYTSEMKMPRILAAGHGSEADQIRNIAQASGIYIADEPDLARQIARAGQAGQSVPRRWTTPIRFIIEQAEDANA